jgi:PAS domain S-box-containing protein
MVGVAPGELMGRDALSIVHPDDRSISAEHLRRRVEGVEDTAPYEARGVRKDGAAFWFEVLGCRSTFDGRPAVMGTMIDTTTRHTAQQAARRTEERLARTFSLSPVPTVLSRIRDGHIIDVNPAFEALVGYDRASLVGHTAVELQLWVDLSVRAALVVEVIAGGVARERAVSVRRRDGGIRETLGSFQRLDVDGEPVFLATLEDVTERNKAQRLVAQLNRLYAMLSHTNEMIMRAQRAEAMLEAACRIAVEQGGLTMAWIGLVDEAAHQLVPVASAGAVDGYLDRVRIDVADPVRSAGPTGQCLRTGAHVTCSDIARDPVMEPWRDEALRRGYRSSGAFPLKVDGAVVGAFTLYASELGALNEPHELALLDQLAMDIGFALEVDRRRTERRQVDEALRESESQLRQAQKLEAIGVLAGGIAHDFNNILLVILSYAELAMRRLPPDDPICEDLHEIDVAGHRAAELTRQLLAFSRQQVMQPRRVELNEIVEGTTNMLRRLIGEDVQLVTIRSVEPAPLFVDPGQIEQVLMNLAVNARDAMPRGGTVTVRVDCAVLGGAEAARLGVEPGPHVVLSFSDTGHGMDKATQARIFEPFFTTKPVGRGTGLGLSMVFGIIRQSAGAIAVESTPGKGTTFRIWLPLADGSAVALAPPARAVEGPAVERGTILLVEDDEPVRRIVHTLLARHGYDVIEASSPGDALILFELNVGKIDLVLTDVVMPLMSGDELARRLARLRPSVRVLFMSGYPGRPREPPGAVGFVDKPFASEELLAAVRAAMGARHLPPAITLTSS